MSVPVAHLAGLGYRTLRFTDLHVLDDQDSVFNMLPQHSERAGTLNPSSPPPLEGEAGWGCFPLAPKTPT